MTATATAAATQGAPTAPTAVSLPQLSGSHLLTHSRMSCFKTCQRKHFFQYELGVGRDYDGEPLRMGAAVHEGLDALYKGEPIEKVISVACANYDQLPSWATSDEAVHEWRVEREKVLRMLMGYVWRWQFGQGGVEGDILRSCEVIESERSFEIPIKNPETGSATPVFKLGGKIDKIVKLADGRIAIVEHKTTGEDLSPESDYWKRLRIDQQISTYWVAARALGYDVRTVIYDVIRKPEIRPRQIPELDGEGFKITVDANGERVFLDNGKPRQSADEKRGYRLVSRTETPEEYGERFNTDIGERPDWYYARQEIPRLEADLGDYELELWQIQQQVRDAQRNERWFRNSSACLMFGKCTYFDVCANAIDLRIETPAGFVRRSQMHPELD